MEFFELIERWNVWRFSGYWSNPTMALYLMPDFILLVSRSNIFSFLISCTICLPSFLLTLIGILRSKSLTSCWLENTYLIIWLELRELASPVFIWRFWLELLWFILAINLLKLELWFLKTWGCFLLPTFGWLYFYFWLLDPGILRGLKTTLVFFETSGRPILCPWDVEGFWGGNGKLWPF